MTASATSATGGQPLGATHAISKHEFDLPAEDPHTELPHDERSTFVDAASGEVISWPATKASEGGKWILACVDLEAPQAQVETVLNAAKRLVKAGDFVILFTVLPTQIGIDGGLAALGGAYDAEYQLRMLRKLRDERKQTLVTLSKDSPAEVKMFVRLSHGGVERQILHAAEDAQCDLIISSKRKLGHGQKLVTTSVSSWIVSKAPCDVLIAK